MQGLPEAPHDFRIRRQTHGHSLRGAVGIGFAATDTAKSCYDRDLTFQKDISKDVIWREPGSAGFNERNVEMCRNAEISILHMPASFADCLHLHPLHAHGAGMSCVADNRFLFCATYILCF